MKTLKILLRSGLFVAAFLTFAGIAHATDFTVNTLDFGADNSTCDVTKCTINEAIAAAKADPGPGPNRIIFDPAISGGTINVTSHLDLDGAFPELTIFANNDITLAATSGGFDNYTLYIAPTTSNVTVDGLNFNEGGEITGLGLAGVGAVKIGGGDVTVTLQNNKFIRNTCSTDNHTLDISLHSADVETIISNNTGTFTSLFFYTETEGASYTITNNELTNGCIASMIYLKAGAGTISGNTIYSSAEGYAPGERGLGIIAYDNDLFGVTGPSSEWGTVNINNNELYSTDTNTDDGADQFTGISITERNRSLTFNITNNTILPADSNKYLDFGISVNSGDDITITGNKIAMNQGIGGIIFNPGNTTNEVSNVLIEHNTVYGSNANPGEIGIGITNSPPGTELTLTNATIKNNIFANLSTGIIAGLEGDPNGMPTFVNFVNDYNIYYQRPSEERDCASMAITGSEALGANSLACTVDPAFTDPDNYDFTLLPYSYAIGFADDGSDAGAEDYDGVRARTTIYVDDDGVIDHETPGSLVDYNDIQSAIYAAAPAGDTILVAAGTYTETPDLYGKALTLTGESAENTIIDADEEDVAMTMSSDSVVSNFTIQNTRASTNYEVELHTYDYDGNTYDDGTEGGVPIMLFAVAKSTPADPENDFDFFAEGDILEETASNIGENLNLGLASGSGLYFTIYYVDSLYPDQATAQAHLDELEMGLTIDKWFPDTFTYSGGVFTFTDPEIADPTVALTVGYNEPTITNIAPEPQGGLYFENTSGTSVSDVNIDTHGIGVYFTGDTLTNTVLNVIFSNISICDTFSDATGTNSVNGQDVVEELCLVIPDPEDPEEPDPDATSPVGLTALTLGSRTSSSVTLNWSQVVEANFSHYEIWYGTNATDVANRNGSAAEWDIDNAANLSTISTTSTTITGLSSSTQYYFKIWAVDTSNNQETVASLSVTTSSNGGGGGGGGVVTTPNKPEVEEIVINGPPTNPAITDITETIIDTTETVKDTIIKDNYEREAVQQVSDIIAEILTTDLVDKIVDLDADIEPTEEDTSSPYTPEDLAVLTDPNEDIDGDGISNADEIARGTDPLVNNTGTIDNLFTKPLEDKEINSGVGALKVLGVGDEGFVVSGSTTPESKVEITITNSKGYKVTLKTTADINGNYILPVTVTDQLIDGSLLIKATNEEGKKDVVLAKFKESTLQKPTLTFEGEKVVRYEDLTLRELIALIEASNEYKNIWAQGSNVYQLSSLLGTSIEKKIAFTLERADFKTIEGGKIIVKGKATPGSTVVLAYKSVIYSSVVIADKNGNFTAELPRDLQEELAKDPNATDALHEFIVFAMDYKKNEASAFNKGQFRLFK